MVTDTDLTERARALVTEMQDACGIYHTSMIGRIAAFAAEACRAAQTVAEQIGAEIVSIMETHDQQEAEHGYVDTPGGLEHMGDVWRLLGRWRDRLASPAPQEETR